MKVMQLNAVYNVGSTGVIVSDLHELSLRKEIDSYVAYSTSPLPAEKIKNGYKIGNWLDKKLHAAVLDDFFPDEFEEEKEFDVIREKTVALKPQSVEEAILQMNLLGHQFYMFLNADTDEINVVYKRNATGYGLLSPDFDD
jgi:putative sigma-54 modulation protein